MPAFLVESRPLSGLLCLLGHIPRPLERRSTRVAIFVWEMGGVSGKPLLFYPTPTPPGGRGRRRSGGACGLLKTRQTAAKQWANDALKGRCVCAKGRNRGLAQERMPGKSLRRDVACACWAVMIGEPLVGSIVASEEAVKKSLETMLSCITIFCLLKNRQTAGSRRFTGVTQVVAVEIHLVFEIEAPGNLLDRE